MTSLTLDCGAYLFYFCNLSMKALCICKFENYMMDPSSLGEESMNKKPRAYRTISYLT